MWARRSNFAQAIERAAVYQGEEMATEWEDCEPQYAFSWLKVDGITHAAYHLKPMNWDDVEEFHDAQLAARAARNVPFACPDLDQEWPIDESLPVLVKR